MTLEIGFQCWFLTQRNYSHGSRDTSVFLQYFNNSYIFLIFQNAENKISAELVTRTYVKNSSFKVLLYIIESPALFVTLCGMVWLSMNFVWPLNSNNANIFLNKKKDIFNTTSAIWNFYALTDCIALMYKVLELLN